MCRIAAEHPSRWPSLARENAANQNECSTAPHVSDYTPNLQVLVHLDRHSFFASIREDSRRTPWPHHFEECQVIRIAQEKDRFVSAGLKYGASRIPDKRALAAVVLKVGLAETGSPSTWPLYP
jgi:hypothetical protein